MFNSSLLKVQTTDLNTASLLEYSITLLILMRVTVMHSAALCRCYPDGNGERGFLSPACCHSSPRSEELYQLLSRVSGDRQHGVWGRTQTSLGVLRSNPKFNMYCIILDRLLYHLEEVILSAE